MVMDPQLPQIVAGKDNSIDPMDWFFSRSPRFPFSRGDFDDVVSKVDELEKHTHSYALPSHSQFQSSYQVVFSWDLSSVSLCWWNGDNFVCRATLLYLPSHPPWRGSLSHRLSFSYHLFPHVRLETLHYGMGRLVFSFPVFRESGTGFSLIVWIWRLRRNVFGIWHEHGMDLSWTFSPVYSGTLRWLGC